MPEEKNPVKEAFSRVKSDIFTLESQILALTREIQSLKRTLTQTDKPTDTQTDTKIPYPTHENQTNIQTDKPQNQTFPHFQQTNTSLSPQEEALKTPNLQVSTGNRGVPTDRQTNQQTDRHTQKFALIKNESLFTTSENSQRLNEQISPIKETKPFQDDKIAQISRVSELVSSLDSLKKDIRTMFKRLTPQEMLVYSAIYQLSDEGFIVDYPLIAKKTALTESSIRDYILKLFKKGVPLEKSKENNKRIILTIPQDFKKVASLTTIISLREL